MKVSEILKGLRQRQDPKNIVEVFVCPLCLTRYKTKEEAEKCLSKGVPQGARAPDVEENSVVCLEKTDYLVTGYGLDQSHQKIMAFVKLLFRDEVLGEEMPLYIPHFKKTPKIVSSLKERAKKGVKQVFICPICYAEHSSFSKAEKCLEKKLPEINNGNGEITLVPGDFLLDIFGDILIASNFCLTRYLHDNIRVSVWPNRGPREEGWSSMSLKSAIRAKEAFEKERSENKDN